MTEQWETGNDIYVAVCQLYPSLVIVTRLYLCRA